MTRRKTRAARPMPPRPKGGAFERASRVQPRTSPAFRRGPRPPRGQGFSLRTKLRLVLLSTTLAAVLLFRVFHAPLQAWLQVHGAPGRLLVLLALALPTLVVLGLHPRPRAD